MTPQKSELNREMAARVMQWAETEDPRVFATCGQVYVLADDWTPRMPHKKFNPCENPADAMAVLKKIHDRMRIETGKCENGYYVWQMTNAETELYAEADTIEMAIVLFAQQLFK